MAELTRFASTPARILKMVEGSTLQLLALGNTSPREILEECSDQRFNLSNIKIASHGSVTRGGQGEVVLGHFVSSPEDGSAHAGRPLAVKRLHLGEGNNTMKGFTAFTYELCLRRGLSHPNIVSLVGFVEAESSGIAWLVSDWEPNGNLHEFITSANWTIPERISLIKDLFEGIGYLHTRELPICHGDLKASNILINADYRAMITDFGSARFQAPNTPSSGNVGPETGSDGGSESDNDVPDPVTVEFSSATSTLLLNGPAWALRWAAPEVLADESSGLASDIWACGWMCWEVMTDHVPFSQIEHSGSIMSRPVTGRLPAIQDDNQMSQVLTLCGLMMDCWKQSPEDRPSSLHCQETINWMPSAIPSPAIQGNSHNIRSTNLLLRLGEMHWAQDNIESAMHSYREALDLARGTRDPKVTGAGLLGLADVFRRLSRTSDAEEHTSEALKIFTRIRDDWGVARCHLGLAQVQHMRSKYFEAEQLFSKALEIYARIQDHAGAVAVLEGLSEVSQAQFKYLDAIKYLSDTVNAYKGVGNEIGQGNTLIRLGNIYRVLSRYKEADFLFREALNIFTRLGDLGARGNAFFELANLRSLQSNAPEAETFYLQAVHIYEQIMDQSGEARALNGLGEACRAQSRLYEAEGAFSRASAICNRIGNDPEQGKAMIGLGKIYRVQFKYAEARDAFNRALEVCRRTGNDMGKANALNGLGEVSLGYSKYPEAIVGFSEALAVSDSLNYDVGRGNALLGLGHSNRAQEMYPAAEAFFVRALEVYTRMENVTGKAHALNELGRAYVVQSKYPQAEICFSDAMEYFRQSGQQTGRLFFFAGSNPRFNLNSIRIAPHGSVTRGGQGEVALGSAAASLEDGSANASRPLAVKKLHLGEGVNTAKDFTAFSNELGLLRCISHPNIASSVGFFEAESGVIAGLVSAWEPNGNLHEFIASGNWESPECISLIQDVMEGVAYLHPREPPICHGDLKSLNILINSSYRAIITDFVSARLQYLDAPSSGNAGSETGSDGESESGPDPLTVEYSTATDTLLFTGPESSLRWAAPEVLTNENRSLASDIWACGWIAWEVLTEHLPFPHTQTQYTGSSVSRSFTGRLPAIQDDSQRSHVQTLCDLMMDCWKQSPEDRPSSLDCRESVHLMGNSHNIRSTNLLLKLGEMYWAEGNIESAMHSFREVLDLARRTRDLKVTGAGLLGLADVFRRLSRTSDAEEHTSEALKIFTRIRDDWGVARCYLGLAQVQHILSKYLEAEQLYAKALEVYTQIQDHEGALKVLDGLGEVCQAQFKYLDAIKYLSDTVNVYKGVGNELGQGNTLIRLGNIYRALSRYKEADFLFLEALNIFTRLGNLGARGNAFFELANLRSLQSNAPEAETLYLQAVHIYEQLKDQVGEARALNGLGEACRAQSRLYEAEGAFSRASAICNRIGNDPEQGKAMLGLGKIYRVQFKYAEARDTFNRALEVCRRTGDDMGRANALNGLGEVSLGYSKYPEAIVSFSEALAVSDSLNYDVGRGNALLGLGHSNRAQEMYPAAEAFFVRALEVYTRMENVTGKAHALNELGRAYVVQSKYPQAEICFSDAMDYFRQSGQQVPTASTLISLGQISMALQDTRTAEERWTEARKLFTVVGHKDGTVAAEKFLSQVWQARNAGRGSRFHLALVFTCFGAVLAAWSAVKYQASLYYLLFRFRRIADQ
ncbi:hypothetical protein FRC01_005482 [Tulasnella sp. 417]|nr:hypothetical protein FRC01_005482 [Tulasnella sp. 417]